jgi:hypothetical protein
MYEAKRPSRIVLPMPLAIESLAPSIVMLGYPVA